MIKKITFTYLASFFYLGLSAQDIKTDVLVIGSSPAAYAAAIQAAKSGVKAVLIDAGKFESLTISQTDRAYRAGIYTDFLKRVDSLQSRLGLKDNQNLTSAFTATVFRGWTDTIKNLTRIPGSAIKKVDKNGKGWEIDFTNREIKANILVDATNDFQVARMAGMALTAKTSSSISENIYSDKKYRTSVAVLNKAGKWLLVPLAALLAPSVENLILAAPLKEEANMHTGQAAGATAAYCAFFKKSTKEFNLKTVREIQNELFIYKAKIFKFDDIAETDSSLVALQHIAATGILKVQDVNGKILFNPGGTVSAEELRQPFREFYSRSQIWFLDNKPEKMTLENTLSLIKFVGSRAEELNREVENAWSKSLKLPGRFDLKKPLTRREFAILLDTYLQPFVVYVDMEGEIKR